ncbi:MAG: hypothetical protein IJM54_01505 [Thermoguttaceae bacterium]|nr:hypothetical protein [Thermoguttaceae bacterium]
MEYKVAYNDWRDAMTIFLDDMSDFYNHVFIMAFKEQMLPNEIAKATSRPVYFIESIVNHLSAIGETIHENLLDAELSCGGGASLPLVAKHESGLSCDEGGHVKELLEQEEQKQ